MDKLDALNILYQDMNEKLETITGNQQALYNQQEKIIQKLTTLTEITERIQAVFLGPGEKNDKVQWDVPVRNSPETFFNHKNQQNGDKK